MCAKYTKALHAWASLTQVLGVVQRNSYCLVLWTCSKAINDDTKKSIKCDSCLSWFHFDRVSLKNLKVLSPRSGFVTQAMACIIVLCFIIIKCILWVSLNAFLTFNALKTLVILIGQETKTFIMLGEVGMANKSTKTTQTSVWMAQHNERTRLHDLSSMPTNLCVH